MFSTLGVSATLGRTLTAADSEAGSPPVVMIGYGLWQRLGAPADIVGRVLPLNEVPRAIVGVAPPGFRVDVLPMHADVFVPLTRDTSAGGEPRHSDVSRDWETGAGRLDRRRERGGRHRRTTSRARVSGHQRRPYVHRASASGRNRRTGARSAGARRGADCAGAAGRCGQPRRARADAHGGTAARSGRPSGARRRAVAPRARVDGRGSGRERRGRDSRRARGTCGARRLARRPWSDASASRGCERRRADVRGSRGHCRTHRVRRRADAAVPHAAAARNRGAAHRPSDREPSNAAPASGADCRANVARVRADLGGDAPRTQPAHGAVAAARIRDRSGGDDARVGARHAISVSRSDVAVLFRAARPIARGTDRARRGHGVRAAARRQHRQHVDDSGSRRRADADQADGRLALGEPRLFHGDGHAARARP